MTEPQKTDVPDTDLDEQQDDSDVIEPEDGGAADPGYPQDNDPVTRRQTDPAAMSEHERNLRQAEQYDIQTGAAPGDPYPA